MGVTRSVSVLKKHDEKVDLGLIPVGKNKGHMDFLETEYSSRLETKNIHKERLTFQDEVPG